MKVSLFRIVLMLFCITSIAVSAQEKVVENSGKKPKWIGTTMPETIIVTADAPDMMEARNKCMELVKQEIVNSVAVNINSSSFSSKTQTSFNEHYALKTEYSSEIKTIAARLPFISGISVSDAETYWERIYVKKEKRYFYRFHLKYSYPEITKKKLIFEFEKNDEEKSLQLEKLKSEYNNIYSVEEIGSRIVELRALAEYFFDDVRKSEVSADKAQNRGEVKVKENSKSISKEEVSKVKEDRQARHINRGLRDLIRILLIRELLGRPIFPGGNRPPMPPRPPRPPFPGGPGNRPGMRPPISPRSFENDFDIYEF